MSEIKGQLLSIILVLMVFAAVSATVTLTFRNLTTSISNQVSEVVTNAE